ncbi:MAG: L-serine ammonia-lyase, iron-sulfur-dependent, subunit alpha [Clostridia bacterium]|jgi:L-serine dehydratase|nr:L-serine ammonia-lyase, iron-sulfur-dependent, subunit alpha [Clostridia bacterium]MCI1999350.1 L-serine ammonia-lyase, iron-sulfur-dependent, subunit alpha [Clostridia bacterium]MCI2015148.1 L-serine ammonia-lyase, iron-sulfur-dependent, subunit alpha [Clostridia bacterium]
MSFKSLSDMLNKSNDSGTDLFETILSDDMSDRDVTRESSLKEMRYMWDSMKKSYENHDDELKSASGLVGGDAAKLKKYNEGESICGSFIVDVMTAAISVAESNACMKCIVAAPTAGSCGVMPGVLIPYKKRFNEDDENIIKAMYIAAGIGAVIAQRASISGAQGGCQAEIGSASAMAAAAVAYLKGGSSEQVLNASALALKNMLGLICDPVAGLVEVPCVKRNAAGAVNAVMAADMSLAGIKSVIPPDEVIDAMGETGSLMAVSLRETSKAGLATTETGCRIAKCRKHF